MGSTLELSKQVVTGKGSPWVMELLGGGHCPFGLLFVQRDSSCMASCAHKRKGLLLALLFLAWGWQSRVRHTDPGGGDVLLGACLEEAEGNGFQ